MHPGRTALRVHGGGVKPAASEAPLATDMRGLPPESKRTGRRRANEPSSLGLQVTYSEKTPWRRTGMAYAGRA